MRFKEWNVAQHVACEQKNDDPGYAAYNIV